MKKIALLLASLTVATAALGQNPICPIGTYIADPTARVWKDGQLYIYGSTDIGLEDWCSYKHDVLYTKDMEKWGMTTDIISSMGENDAIDGTDARLFAPDAYYKDGKYYLYFCTPDTNYSEGVAISSDPKGPFTNAQKLNLGGHNQIDPTIFIDDDGQAYYYWGQGAMKGAKMKDNMVELDESTIKDGLVTSHEHFFHEGAFVFKRNGIYYAVYAHDGRHGRRPTCIGYATSDSPMGPFKYQGVIVDNMHCDPGVWNNHGSVAEYKGQWYVFYHRSSHSASVMRRACVEPIKFNEDGTIDEVEMTTQGASGPLPAENKLEAERACLLKGNCRVILKTPTNEALVEIMNGDGATYRYLNFKNSSKKFTAKVTPLDGGKINVRLDSAEGEIIGTLDIPKGEENAEAKSYSCDIKAVDGVHALYLEFVGGEGKLFELDCFKL